MKKMIFLNLLLLLLVACGKDDPTPSPPTVIPKMFEKIWSTRIYEAPLENVSTRNAYHYDDVYIVGGDNWAHPDPGIFAFDTKTGQLKWKWTPGGRIQEPAKALAGKDHILVIHSHKGVIGFDIRTQSLLWEIVFADEGCVGGNGVFIYGDDVYFTKHIYDKQGPETYYRANINTGEVQKICTVDIQDGWTPSLSPPAFWVDPESKDSLMVFLNGKSKSFHTPQESPTDLLVVNLRTKKVVLKVENCMEVPTNLGSPPVIFENSVIFGGDWSVYCIDLQVGSVKWRTPLPGLQKVGNFNRTGLLLDDNRVYVNPDVFGIGCLDAVSGNILWYNENTSANCTPNMLIQNDMLITTSVGLGKIFIFDSKSGYLLHEEFSPKTFHTDVKYDKITDSYFVLDFAHAVCFKINKQ
jgi:outer membrane protein assembly factor BamB